MGEKRDQGTVPGEPEGRAHSERFEDHPTPEELSAYQAGELTPEQSDAIQEHLAGCELCTEVLLDLHRFLDLPDEDRPREGVADFQTEAEWRTLRAKLPLTQKRKPARRSTYAALAAILLIAIGFSFYVLSRDPERYQTLDPRGNYRGGSKIAIVRPPVTLVTLRLKVPSGNFPEYRALLRVRAGKGLEEFSSLKRTSSYDVEIPLSRRDLSPGEYQIDLYGVESDVSTPVDIFDFNVADR